MYSLSTKFNQLCELWCANALKGYYIPKPTTIGRKRFYSLQLCAGYARTKHFECSRHFAFRLEPDPPFHAPDTLCVTRNKTPNKRHKKHYFVGTQERLNHSLQNCTPKSFQLMWFVVSKCFQWRPYCWTTHPPLAGTEFAHCSYARAMRGPSTLKAEPGLWNRSVRYKDHFQRCARNTK